MILILNIDLQVTTMKRLIITIITAFLVLGVCSISFGQTGGQSDNATIQSSAEVLTQLAVTGGNSLNFGDVSPGVDKTVNYYDSNAGTFTVTAGENATVDLNFTLPTELSGQSTSATLDITFSSTDATYETTSSTSSGSSNEFDPNNGNTINSFPSSDITVFIGGTVNPSEDQSAEIYQGDITLTAIYN